MYFDVSQLYTSVYISRCSHMAADRNEYVLSVIRLLYVWCISEVYPNAYNPMYIEYIHIEYNCLFP